MTEKETVFLTLDEAVRALCSDFRQYDPQILLLCQTLRLISRGETVVKRDRKRAGAWISLPGRRNMHWMGPPELVEHACEALSSADLNPELLSSICGSVFHTRAFPAPQADTGRMGIRIETGMEDFHCRQCGQCCQSLDYRKEVTAQDISQWRELGRLDILEWVGVFEGEGLEPAYRIWMIPGTSQRAEECPFLHKESSENRWYCRIQDVKPAICRQYPASRKHALLTGCPGFEKPA